MPQPQTGKPMNAVAKKRQVKTQKQKLSTKKRTKLRGRGKAVYASRSGSSTATTPSGDTARALSQRPRVLEYQAKRLANTIKSMDLDSMARRRVLDKLNWRLRVLVLDQLHRAEESSD